MKISDIVNIECINIASLSLYTCRNVIDIPTVFRHCNCMSDKRI